MRTTLLAAACLAVLSASAAADNLKVPADFATIGDAVAAAQDGDTITVSKGTYLEAVSVSVPNVKLVGKKAVIDAEYAAPCLELLADGISVTGFTLVNGTDGIFASGEGISISKCNVFSCSVYGIEAEGASITISKNTVVGCNSTGIQSLHWLPGSSLIEKNTCHNNGGSGIVVTGDDSEVSKNDCTGNQINGITVVVASLSLEGPPVNQPLLLQKNDCEGNLRDGLEVFNVTASVVTIDGNDLSGNGAHGLEADGAGFVITKNDCNDNRDNGMNLGLGNSQVSKNTASGNEGQGLFVGTILHLGPPGDGPVGSGSDNVVEDNTCKDNAGDGIQVVVGDSNSVVDNTCTGNFDDGIDVDDTDCDGTLLEDNTCNDNGHEGIDNSGAGPAIAGNTCKKNGYGIGPDIAGLGDSGLGTVATFTDNVFDTGGETEPSRLDDGEATGL